MAKVDELYKLTVEIGAKVDGLKSGLNKGKRELNLFGGQVKRIGALIAGAFTISKLASFTFEVSRLAGEAEGVSNAFKRIANQNTMDELKRATRGTVSELELMKRTVQASNFQLPIEQLASLFEFASRRAQETGESVDYLVNSIVLGIGRKSPLILDNLGISAVRLRQELKGTGVELTTVADIAAAVGKIAQEEMSKMGDVLETSKDRTEQVTAEFTNMKVEIGAIVNQIKDDFSPEAKQLLVDLTNIIAAIDILYNKFKETGDDRINALAQAWDAIKKTNPIYWLIKYNSKVKEGIHWLGGWGKEIKETAKEQEGWNKVIGPESDKKSATGLIAGFEKKIEDLKKSLKEQLTETSITKVKDQIIEAEKELERLNNLQTGETSRYNPEYFQALDKALKEESEYNQLLLQNNETEKEYAKQQTERYRQYQIDISAYKNSHEQLAEVVAKSFASATSSAIMFGENFRDIVKKTIATVIAEAVAFMVGNAIKESSMKGGLAGIILAPIAGAAAGAAAKGALDAAIPSYAGGGVAMNKQLAIVGDNPSGKELMLPLESGILNKLGNQNIHISGTFRQRGRDLVAVINEENKYANQIY